MAMFMARPPGLKSFDRATGDLELSVVVLVAVVLFAAGIASVSHIMALDGEALPEALKGSLPFFLAPVSGLAVWAWRHVGALLVAATGALLTVGSVFTMAVGTVSESWRASLSDGALGFLLLFALPMLLTGLFYVVRFPDGQQTAGSK